MRKLAVLMAAGFLTGGAHAEIVKTASINCQTNQICLYWWPKLPALEGWYSDSGLNFKMGANGSSVLIPNGKTFSNAPAIIYARAKFIERYDWELKTKSTLASFIADDQKAFRKDGAAIVEAPALKTGDGQELKVVAYTEPKNWECVAYGVEEGYYLMFVLSANSEAGYNEALPVFQDLIARYKK